MIFGIILRDSVTQKDLYTNLDNLSGLVKNHLLDLCSGGLIFSEYNNSNFWGKVDRHTEHYVGVTDVTKMYLKIKNEIYFKLSRFGSVIKYLDSIQGGDRDIFVFVSSKNIDVVKDVVDVWYIFETQLAKQTEQLGFLWDVTAIADGRKETLIANSQPYSVYVLSGMDEPSVGKLENEILLRTRSRFDLLDPDDRHPTKDELAIGTVTFQHGSSDIFSSGVLNETVSLFGNLLSALYDGSMMRGYNRSAALAVLSMYLVFNNEVGIFEKLKGAILTAILYGYNTHLSVEDQIDAIVYITSNKASRVDKKMALTAIEAIRLYRTQDKTFWYGFGVEEALYLNMIVAVEECLLGKRESDDLNGVFSSTSIFSVFTKLLMGK